MTKAITENPEVHRRSTTKNIHKCISKTFVLLGAKLPPQQNLDSAQLFWMLRLCRLLSRAGGVADVTAL